MSWDPKRKSSYKQQQQAAWVIAKAGGLCQIKGPECIRIATEDDHIVPLAEGGSDKIANHQAACSACHLSKTMAEAQRGRARMLAKTVKPTIRHPGLR